MEQKCLETLIVALVVKELLVCYETWVAFVMCPAVDSVLTSQSTSPYLVLTSVLFPHMPAVGLLICSHFFQIRFCIKFSNSYARYSNLEQVSLAVSLCRFVFLKYWIRISTATSVDLYRRFSWAVGDPPRWPRDSPLSTKVGTKFRRQVAVAQSI
jgi:hypothetical protein